MIEYYVSTMDYYDSGFRCGQMVTDSVWSCDIPGIAETARQAMEIETKWMASAMGDDCHIDKITDVDTRLGRIYYVDVFGDEYVCEVSIDIIESREGQTND